VGLKSLWLELKFQLAELRYRIDRRILPYLVADPKKCTHEWRVVSTASHPVCLELQCSSCGTYGTVDDPTADEWEEAFHAPSKPYPWTEPDRVSSTLRPISDYLPP
jgi:hypothetical protein